MNQVLGAIFGNLWRSACVVLLTLLAVQTARIEGPLFIHGFKEQIADRDAEIVKWKDAFAKEKDAFDQTKLNYVNAQRVAQAENRQHVAEVEANQERITQNVSSNYQRRIAALDAQYDRLREQAGSTPGSSLASAPGTAGVPAVSRPPCGADEATVHTLTKQSIQLDELITWVEKQKAGSNRLSGISVTPASSSSHTAGDEADRNDHGALAAH